jgi:biotin carboxyl carrier protein
MEKYKWQSDSSNFTPTSGAKVVWDNEQYFTIQFRGKNFKGEILEEKLEEKKLVLKVNHRIFTISKTSSLDELINSLGLNVEKIKKLSQLKSPMPGRVVSIAIAVGDAVVIGDKLLTLEAMKMENVLKAEGEGKVKSIRIAEGDVVDKGAVLIDFE